MVVAYHVLSLAGYLCMLPLPGYYILNVVVVSLTSVPSLCGYIFTDVIKCCHFLVIIFVGLFGMLSLPS